MQSVAAGKSGRIQGALTAFFHRTAAQLPNADVELLPNHDMVFEFKLAPGKQEGMMTAQDVTLAARYPAL